MKKIQLILEGINAPITGVVEGNLDGLPCLVLGPASIYIPTLPSELKKQYLFYGADYYWTNVDNIATDIISSLNTKQMVVDGERIRTAFEEKGFPVAKTLVLGESLIGWLAIKQAELYPDKILGIVNLNTPLTNMKALSEKQSNFFKPYNPSLTKLATEKSIRLREEHQHLKSKYEIKKNIDFSNNTDDYLAELKREKIRYMENDILFNKTLSYWENFNISTRQRFFENVKDIHPEHFKRFIKCPVFLALGIRDGVVPPYTMVDALRDFPKNFEYYIFDSKHMPQFENQENFTNQFNEWISDNVIKSKPNPIGLSKL